MRCLVLILLAIATVTTVSASEQIVCKPGTSFMRYCNRCRCSNSGKSAACDSKWCNRDIFNEDGSIKESIHADGNEKREKREASKPQVCAPNTFTRNYCNVCWCSADGTKRSCTEKPCGNGEFDRNGMRPYRDFDSLFTRQKREADENVSEKNCEPGKSFKRYCNSCRCNQEGSDAACTRMYCPPDAYDLHGARTQNWHQSIQRFGRRTNFTGSATCTPGAFYRDYCNDCHCAQDGKSAVCTFMICPDGVFRKDGSRIDGTDRPVQTYLRAVTYPSYQQAMTVQVASICTPGQSFKNYCNNCQCLPGGRSALCTYLACPVGVYNRDGSRIDGLDRNVQYYPVGTTVTMQSVCTPGQVFKYYCNTCRCAPDGRTAACTYLACPVRVYNRDGSRIDGLDRPIQQFPQGMTVNLQSVCSPGQEFKYYCNNCRCNSDGRSAACTYLACPVGVYNSDGSRIDGLDRAVQYLPQGMTVTLQSVCSPGQTFKNYCNTCRCGYDGRSAACTYLACPLGVYNKDGSRVDGLDRPVYRLPRMNAEGPLVCEPGKSFKSFCNTCHCSDDGKSAGCTYMYCTPGAYHQNGTLIARARGEMSETKTQICEPDSTFKQSCNTCRCSKDGTQAVCTIAYCYD